MKILTMKVNKEAGVPFYRQTQLMDYLRSKGHTVEDMIDPTMNNIGECKHQLKDVDYLWLISPVGLLMREMVGNLIKNNMSEVIMRAAGMSANQLRSNVLSSKDLRIVVDFDDEPITASVNSTDYAHRGRKNVFISDENGDIIKLWDNGKLYDGKIFSIENNYINIKSRIEILKMASVFTSPSETLLRQYGRFNKVQSLLLVPNALDLTKIPKYLPSTDGKIRILWSLGSTHNMDFNEMAPAIGRLMAKDSRVMLVTCGQKFDSPDIPEDRREHYPWVSSMEEYYKQMGTIHADIGLAWVSNTRFNRAKSVIKAVEYMAAGLPVIASMTLYGKNMYTDKFLQILVDPDDISRSIARYDLSPIHTLTDIAYDYVKRCFSIEVIGDYVEQELLALTKQPLYPGLEQKVAECAMKALEPKKVRIE